jgi:hypothetical protein
MKHFLVLFRTAAVVPVGVASLLGLSAHAQGVAKDKTVGNLEVNARFESGPMPTGVTVSRERRFFLHYPHWGDPLEATVAEWKDGHAVPFPRRPRARRIPVFHVESAPQNGKISRRLGQAREGIPAISHQGRRSPHP